MSIVTTNSNSDFVVGQIKWIERQLQSSIEKISSGLRIVHAGDDPVGVSISLQHSARISGTQSAIVNAEESLSMLQIADTALNEIGETLLQMRDLAVLAGNDATLDADDLQDLNSSFSDFRDLITGIADGAKFNGQDLLTGNYDPGKNSQVGPDAGTTMTIYMPDMSADKIDNGTNDLMDETLSTAVKANNALDVVDDSIEYLGSIQSSIGSQEKQLGIIIDTLSAMEMNYAAAKSNITDADMASEISRFAHLQVIAEAGAGTLAHVDDVKKNVISILDKL